jgi:tetratricopeptide (TPR) repeat protein
VAKKSKPTVHVSLAGLRERVARASREGRHHQALELAHTLYRREASDQHRDLVKQATIARARQLRNEGKPRDAVLMLTNAARLDDAPAWLEQLALEMALCGHPAEALTLLDRVPNSAARGRIVGHSADAALAQGPAGRASLAAELQPQFDLVVQAFAQMEAGQDEEAKATLQGIGLQSPFLEWKVFARGLLAFYQGDDVRALENWTRLNAERAPARLAAPLRFRIDAAFRVAQPPATQTLLQQQSDKLQGSTLVQALRGVQKAVANERQLADAFRQAEKLLPNLRRDAPQLAPRLAGAFYWAIISHGQPEDLKRYQRVFGPPADDPKLAKLEALALERRDQPADAHQAWQTFEQSVAGNRSAWPGDQADRVRALVWLHMGRNAADMPDLDSLADLPPFLRNHPARPRPLKPTAEECFEKSLVLAPDQLEGHVALVEYHLEHEKDGKAEKAARRLLQRFPDHAATLERLGDLRMKKRDYAEALGLFQQALKGNPLERRLRGKVGNAHAYHARVLAEAGRFDEARQEYQATLRLEEVGRNASILCKWAACEFKAGDAARAEELLAQAYAKQGHPLPVAFNMLIETIRFKLARPLKTRFDREFKEQLKAAPDAGAAGAVAETVAGLRGAGVEYVGQKTHEKQVTTYLDRASACAFSEQQLTDICGALQELKTVRLLERYLKRGQELFPGSATFYLIEVETLLAQGPHRCPTWRVKPLLEKARALLNAQPPDDRRQRLLDHVAELQQQLHALNPFAAMMEEGMGGMFGHIFGGQPDYDDEDDEYEDDEWE